jgi:hypothetical protein
MKELRITHTEACKPREIRLKRRKGYMSSEYTFSVEKLTLSGRAVATFTIS